MFKRNYYYLVAGLPDIVLDQKKVSLPIGEFKDELRYHLHPDDYSLSELFFMPHDHSNLLGLLRKNLEEFDELGKYPRDVLEAEIKESGETENYIQRIIEAYKNEEPLIAERSWEDQITWLYYDFVRSSRNAFVREWFEFEMNVNNIVAAVNARKHNFSRENILIGDNEIAQAVKKSTLKDFGISAEFQWMDRLMNIQENENLLEREYDMDMLRWDFINDINTFNYFSIELILGYVVKLQMVERWLKLDEDRGRELFRKLLEDLEKSYEFPKEFMINERKRVDQR